MGLSQHIQSDYRFQLYDARDGLVEAACQYVTDLVKYSSGQTNLALSGGSTPKPVYTALSKAPLNWHRVTSTLVDDRITDDPLGSNAAMVRSLFVQNLAADMSFTPLASHEFSPNGFDLTIMGMGTDGHTASWFPGSVGLQDALNPHSNQHTIEIDAMGCPGAGIYPHRLTMTLPAVMNSKQILLLITGEEKRRVFEHATEKSVFEAPVKALLAAGRRLTVMWAP